MVGDGASGVVGDGGGDAHQSQVDRPGLPGAGRGVGQGRRLGEGRQVCGPVECVVFLGLGEFFFP